MTDLRALACLVNHKAHVVRWEGHWGSLSHCIWCGRTPKELEDASSYPFMNVDSDNTDVPVFYRKRRKPKNGQSYIMKVKTHAYLKRFGLTWPQVKDAK